jgi:hypothetical protein
VEYVTADVFNVPGPWSRAFDFVLEAYTLQVLPPPIRSTAATGIADCVAPGGSLLVLCRGRELHDPVGDLPWPLTRSELGIMEQCGLIRATFEEFFDSETPPVRRFRIEYRRLT